MDTVAALLAAVREREGVAFDAPDRTTAYSSHELATTAWKAANLLSHFGVRPGARVAVVVGPGDPGPDDEPGFLAATPQPLLAALGALRLGASVDLAPGATVDATALVAPAAWLDRYDAAPGCTRLAYGAQPSDPAVEHFERQVWSENPVEPPETVDPDAVALADRGTTQSALLDEAVSVAAEYGMADRRVAVRGRLDGTVLARGVLAPLSAGGTVVGGQDGAGDLLLNEDGDVIAR